MNPPRNLVSTGKYHNTLEARSSGVKLSFCLWDFDTNSRDGVHATYKPRRQVLPSVFLSLPLFFLMLFLFGGKRYDDATILNLPNPSLAGSELQRLIKFLTTLNLKLFLVLSITFFCHFSAVCLVHSRVKPLHVIRTVPVNICLFEFYDVIKRNLRYGEHFLWSFRNSWRRVTYCFLDEKKTRFVCILIGSIISFSYIVIIFECRSKCAVDTKNRNFLFLLIIKFSKLPINLYSLCWYSIWKSRLYTKMIFISNLSRNIEIKCNR